MRGKPILRVRNPVPAVVSADPHTACCGIDVAMQIQSLSRISCGSRTAERGTEILQEGAGETGEPHGEQLLAARSLHPHPRLMPAWRAEDTALGRPTTQNVHGRYAATTAKSTAGSMLATRIILPHTRFMPTQNIRMDPMSDR